MSTDPYGVEVSKYAERHFISSFRKKYKGAWDITWRAVEEELKRIETLIGINNYVETIVDRKNILICKTEFRVAGTKESRHGSGNRCIIAVHKDKKLVRVLLVYGKGDVSGSRETDWWKGEVRDNYPDYSLYC
ncbi:hypothetical protein HYV30_01395 [Candidatus Kaiserbacteria bacterium]|nr:hypothetical protein [Candidatus Kaiserbacteria bacterium]